MSILVIGAGPSGLHFAQTALERGQRVTLIDAGGPVPEVPLREAAFPALKQELPDPVDYFLGDAYQGAQLPPPKDAETREYYGMPPSKDHVFAPVEGFAPRLDGLAPLTSFAAGGLAECWTAGAYPFDDHDLTDWPISHADLAPHYATVAGRIGIGGMADDLSMHFPVHDGLRAPIALDQSSARLIARYEVRRDALFERHGIRMGRSRQAALAEDLGDRQGCTECGRCLWGCPTGALYTPALSLRTCLAHPNFTYRPGLVAQRFEMSDANTLRALITVPRGGGAEERWTAEAFALAAGTISSGHLILKSHWHAAREITPLTGLMDNRQVLAPFLNLGMLGHDYDPASYQYHQLAVGMAGLDRRDYVHGQITMLTTGTAHPVIQQMPLDMRASRAVFSTLRSALGVLNLNYRDWRRDENMLTLDPDAGETPQLVIRYRPDAAEPARIRKSLRRMGRFFRALGAPLIPGMTQVRPMGASVHYTGTLPMMASGGPGTVTPEGQSRDWSNLYVVDGSILPALPAKNLTFTLMANATRIARAMT